MHIKTIVIMMFLPVALFGQDSTEIKRVSSAAASFYNWYLFAINNDGIRFDFSVVENNGMCKLDSTEYFEQLRKLGTISDKFLLLEIERTKKCSEFLSTLKWEVYKNTDDPYEYDDHCPSFSCFYWINSQEPVDRVDIREVKITHETAEVDLIFYSLQNNEKIYWEDVTAKVWLEKMNADWQIVGIQVIR